LDPKRDLGNAPISGLLFRFAIPSIVALMVHAGYNIIDRIFIGQMVGPDGLAAAAACFPAMMAQFAFTLLIAVGEAAIVSIKLGQGDTDGARKVFANAVWMSALLSILMPFAGLFLLDPILHLSGAGPATLPLARQYLSTILVGTLPLTGSFILHYHVRAAGHPRAAMILIIIGSGMNAILDPIFIGPLGMGVQGAAIATVISETLSMIAGIVWLATHRSTPSLSRGLMGPDLKLWGSIGFLGLAPFAAQIIGSVQFSILNYQVARFGGEIAVGITGVTFALSLVVSLPVFGIADGMQPIVGYNFGARKLDRVRQAVRLSLLWATVAAFIGTIVVELFPGPAVSMFSTDAEFTEMTVRAVRIVFMTAPLFGMQAIGARYFQAVGKGGLSLFLSLSRQLIFFTPGLLLLPEFFGLDGVWWTAPLADTTSTAMTMGLLVWSMKKTMKEAA